MPRGVPRVWPGLPYPLGAHWDGHGVNFALFSENAERVELCLFSSDGRRETARVRLPEYTNQVWHGYLPGLEGGQLYGYRVYGPYDPAHGHRFNHHKLLIDPYAKKLAGNLVWHDANFGYRIGHSRGDLSFDNRDNAAYMPKCVVVEPHFDWQGDRPPRVRWHETVVYEMHVRGFTMKHPKVEGPYRGTFSGLASAEVLDYLRRLGITTVELLPVHAFVDDRHLTDVGLKNYWGYNTLSFFAPESRYLADGDLDDVRRFVKRAHEVGLEVVLDVVYNHTAEGNHLGPTLSFRGIDNRAYYRLLGSDARYYDDFTGTGNALDLHEPHVLRLVTDSLRYWVEQMHIDGFRFDLATTLAREANGSFDPRSGFLDVLQQDPILSRVKLIAEPWDVGTGGYQMSKFPPGWSEWNDRYRDCVRRYWRGDDGTVGELATRLTGSSDLFDHQGRRPSASVNFVTAHDGFTLADLVSYNDKHNEANPHQNEDGGDHNLSWNCGVEGETSDEEVLALRKRQVRNFLATLLLSQGTPMLVAGDELGRSQGGNNNAYCQDNELSWIDWTLASGDGAELRAFVAALIRFRKEHIVCRRRHFFVGRVIPGTDATDVVWLNSDGTRRMVSDWDVHDGRFLGFMLSGEAGEYHLSDAGEREPGTNLLIGMNASSEPVEFQIPPYDLGECWNLVVDTSSPKGLGAEGQVLCGETYQMQPRSLVLFTCADTVA